MTLRVYYSDDGAKDGSSPVYRAGWRGGGGGTRKYRVAWKDVQEALRQLVGYSYARLENDVRRLYRELPERDPLRPNLFCTDARVVRNETWTGRSEYDRNEDAWTDGVPPRLPGSPNKERKKDDDGLPTSAAWKTNDFKLATIEATFAQAEFTIRPDSEIHGTTFKGNEFYRFVTEKEDRSVKTITLPQGTLWYVMPQNPGEDNTAFETRRAIYFGVPVLEFELAIEWKQWCVSLDGVPWRTINKTIGKVSSKAWQGYEAGTLLYMPPRVERYAMANDRLGCDITHVCLWQPVGWNKLLHVDPAAGLRSYKWVTTDKGVTQEPEPTSLPPDKWLYNSASIEDVFNPNSPA